MRKVTRRIYSDRDKARIAMLLQMYPGPTGRGNIKKVARETGVPIPTVRLWRDKWEKEGYPEAIEEVLPEERQDFVAEATEVRWMILDALREKVDARQLTGRDLITAIGVLTDKINILSGAATARTERVEVSLPNTDELKDKLLDFIDRADKQTKLRRAEIADSEKDEQAKALVEK